jgi:hypothetical protein
MKKMIVQFHDGTMIRQRVIASESALPRIFKDLARCGIDMRTVIATTRHADEYPIGYLHYEYPLVGDRVVGIWGA